jgi:hypothetical protein
VKPELLKVAVPVGTVAGFQLAALLKLPDPGLSCQVASCARAETAAINAEEASSAARTERDRPHRLAQTNGSVLPSRFGGSPTPTRLPPASGRRRRDVPHNRMPSVRRVLMTLSPLASGLAIPLPPERSYREIRSNRLARCRREAD